MHSSPALSAALLAIVGLPAALAAPHKFDISKIHPSNIIQRDVAVIGGGSSGTNAAIGIKDAGKSVIVVENQASMGGHTHTYTDPATNMTSDYGVVVWHNTTIVQDYFKRFNIPLANQSFAGLQNQDYDFTTGMPVNVAPTDPQALAVGFQKYAGFLAQYPELEAGMFLPRPVPKVLAAPFGALVKQLGIEAIVPTLTSLNPGLGDPLKTPVVEFARVCGLGLLQQIGAGSFVTTARRNNSELYAAAQAELEADHSVLLSSYVVKSWRKADGVELLVKTPKGMKLICAKKLLITIPPRMEFLKPFNPTQAETAVFSKLINAGYYTSLVKNSGLPPTLQLSNRAADTEYNLPKIPGIYVTQPTAIPGVRTLYYGAELTSKTYPLSEEEVKAGIVAQLKKLQAANPQTMQQAEPEFVAYKCHAPFYLQATAADILGGIYDQMNALQGQHSTFYSGAAWRAQDSSALWAYNKQVVLPMLLKGL